MMQGETVEGIILRMTPIEGDHTIKTDSSAVNPNYLKGVEYRENCGNCIVAYELRRRGFDVEANPRRFMSVKDWETMFEEFKPLKPTSSDKAGIIDELIREISSWGEGARGTVFGEWDGRDIGHFFSFEVYKGKVMFIDSQKGKDDCIGYLNKMKPSSIIYGRLDNLKPSENSKNTIINRSAKT
jgi:hypothetical protein